MLILYVFIQFYQTKKKRKISKYEEKKLILHIFFNRNCEIIFCNIKIKKMFLGRLKSIENLQFEAFDIKMKCMSYI